MSKRLAEQASGSRRTLLKLLERGHPYIAASLSSLEIQTVLLNLIVRPGKGYIFLPAHHASAYYCLLHQDGLNLNLQRLGTEELPYCFDRVKMAGKIPGIEYISGAMGASALSAVSKALLNPDKKSFLLLGNAELREGRTYEAFAFAATEALDNLVLMVNDNGKSLDGPSTLRYEKLLEGFGFETVTVDGHDIEAIGAAISEALTTASRRGIVFKTMRGHGSRYADLPHCGIKAIEQDTPRTTILGRVCLRLAQELSFTAFAADTAHSTGLAHIAPAPGHRLINVGCSEQLLVGSLEQFILEGVPVVASTFAKFLLETAREQVEHLITLYQTQRPTTPTLLLATHNGLSPGVNGASHHCLSAYEFIGRNNVNLLHASDETQLEQMCRFALKQPELSIILTERESDSFNKTDGKRTARYPDLHAQKQLAFSHGAPEELTAFTQNNFVLLITNGLRLHDALEAAKISENVEVLSLPSFPLNKHSLIPYLKRASRVIIIEESTCPLLSDKVALIGLESGTRACYNALYVREPGVGGYESLIRRNGLGVQGIRDAIRTCS